MILIDLFAAFIFILLLTFIGSLLGIKLTMALLGCLVLLVTSSTRIKRG